jgi:myo-inositol catabolism protein IolC
MTDQLIRIKGSAWCIVPFFDCWGKITPAINHVDPLCMGVIRSGIGMRPPRRVRKALKMARRRAGQGRDG